VSSLEFKCRECREKRLPGDVWEFGAVRSKPKVKTPRKKEKEREE